MKKKLIAASALTFCMLGVSLCAVTANAATEDIVTNDKFVFNANNISEGFRTGAQVASKSNVSLKLGTNYSGELLSGNIDFGDYNFNKGLLAKEKLSTYSYIEQLLIKLGYISSSNTSKSTSQYYISAKEGTKCGFYYTVVDKDAIDNTYYISNNNTIKFVQESKKKTKVLESVTEKLDSMYYSEFTFGNQGTIGMASDTQAILLFGLTIVTEDEQQNRVESNAAIDALIDYYNTNGVSTSYVFNELVNNAKESLANVNHVSQIPNYEEYQNILTKYDELVKVEAKIDTLNNPTTRSTRPNISYNAESKALLDDIANEIAYANSLGIENSNISNYDLYLAALNLYNELEADYLNAQNVVALINDLSDVEYTDSYKNQLDTIEAALNEINDLSLVSNLDEFYAKKAEFDALSNAAVEAFVNKVNEANASKGEASSYALINEAEELYAALIEADKNNEEVAAAKALLEEVKVSYDEYEASVTNNDHVFTYNEDGSIKSIVFIGTINEFTSCDDIARITMYVTNESTGETQSTIAKLVYTSLKLNGQYIKTEQSGVRYIFVKLLNTDNQYDGVDLSMSFKVEYEDGHVVTSDSIVVGVR